MSQAYLNTLDRMEKDIAMVDTGAALASIAISMRRIADVMETFTSADGRNDFHVFMENMFHAGGMNFQSGMNRNK